MATQESEDLTNVNKLFYQQNQVNMQLNKGLNPVKKLKPKSN